MGDQTSPFRTLTGTFLSGLAVVLPTLLAVYLIWWLAGGVEAHARAAILLVLPERFYLSGMGIAAVLLGVLLVGIAARVWLTRWLLEGFDRLMRRIPLVRSIYQPVRDLMDALGGGLTEHFGEVVLVRLPGTEMDTMGFVTRQDLAGLPPEFGQGDEDRVVVHIQWSMQIGGFCVVVPRSAVRTVSMSVEEGMSWALTAGISLKPGADGEVTKKGDGEDEEPRDHDDGNQSASS